MSALTLYRVPSLAAVNFIEALAVAAGAGTSPFVGTVVNNLDGVPPIRERRFLIRAISYTAVERVGLQFSFWADAAGTVFLGRKSFLSAVGTSYNNAGVFNYYVDGLAIPYFDQDRINTQSPPRLHVGAENFDVVAKSAGAPGQIVAAFWLEPMASIQG